MFLHTHKPLIAKSLKYDGPIHAKMAKRSTSHKKPIWIEITAQLLASKVLKENTIVCSDVKRFYLVLLRVCDANLATRLFVQIDLVDLKLAYYR